MENVMFSSQGDVNAMIRSKFQDNEQPVDIKMLNGKTFKAMMTVDGVCVDNLGSSSLLPWIVFKEVVNLLRQNGGRAEKGDAMMHRLGDHQLSLESVEGHIAHVVYGKQIGESVFWRISPLAAILTWAGLCNNERGELSLR